MTRMANYGIVLMSHFAGRDSPRPRSASELAALACLSRPMTTKVLKLLAHSGLLESRRGAKGGYLLSRPPADISIAEIITALDGPISLTECADAGGCESDPACPVGHAWQRINIVIRHALESVSLTEFAEPRLLKLRLEALTDGDAV